MLIEKLQLESALEHVNAQIMKLGNAAIKETGRLGFLETQKNKLLAWSAWMQANHVELPIRALEEQDSYDPSAALNHFWTGFFYEKTHVPFNIISCYSIPRFKLHLFKKTIQCITDRHELLRTIPRFCPITHTYKQKILPCINPDTVITVIDIRTAAQQGHIIEAHLKTAQQHIFEFEKGPAFYFTALQYSEHECCILFNISHAIFDGFSKKLFEDEFMIMYNAFSRNEDDPFEPLPVQFRDFCEWEKNFRTQEACHAYKKYWFSNSENRFPQRNLSTEVSGRPLKDTSYRASLAARIQPYLKNTDAQTLNAFYGVVGKAERTPVRGYRFTLDNETFIKCNTFCRRRKITLYPLFVSVFKALLYKRTAYSDIVIGANIALRDRPALQKLMGFFVNTVLVRSHVEGSQPFSDLLTEVIINISLSSFFKYYTMSKVLDDLDIPFNSINTLFLNMPPAPSPGELTDFSTLHYDNNALGYFDIDLHIQRYSNGIEFNCNYDHTIYSADYITILFSDFITLLKQCINAPATAINHL